MIKVKETKQLSAEYQLILDDDETFDFNIVFDREEWVLQGEQLREGRGVRYSQAELTAILKVLEEKNGKRKK